MKFLINTRPSSQRWPIFYLIFTPQSSPREETEGKKALCRLYRLIFYKIFHQLSPYFAGWLFKPLNSVAQTVPYILTALFKCNHILYEFKSVNTYHHWGTISIIVYAAFSLYNLQNSRLRYHQTRPNNAFGMELKTILYEYAYKNKQFSNCSQPCGYNNDDCDKM